MKKRVKAETQKIDEIADKKVTKVENKKTLKTIIGIISFIGIFCIITFFILNKEYNVLNQNIEKEFVCYEHEDKNRDRQCDKCNYTLSDMDYVKATILETTINDKNITLTGNMTNDAKLEVKEIEEANQETYIQKATEFFKEDFIQVDYAFDIKIMDNYGVYQPSEYNQKIEVKLSEVGLDKKINAQNNYAVLHIKEDESLEILNAKVNQNSITFETSSFSVFLVIEVAGKTVSFNGEHVKIYDLEMNEITEGTVVASNTNFKFIAIAEEGYGINPPDKKQTNITCTGSVWLKEFLVKSITADMEIEIVTTMASNITVQPEPVKTPVRTVPTLEITAENATNYQWQIRRSRDGYWENAIGSGTTSRTFKPNVDEQGSYEYRCLVGNDAYIGDDRTISDTILVVVVSDFAVTYDKPIILSQDILKQKVKIGEEQAVYEVTAQGKDLTFTWQYRTKADSYWQNITNGVGTVKNTTVSTVDDEKVMKSTFTTVVANNSLLLAEFRCLVGNRDYRTDDAPKTDNMLYLAVSDDNETKYAYLKMDITQQPTSEKVKIGEQAVFRIETEAVDIYKWQYKTSYEAETWQDVDDKMGMDVAIATGYDTAELAIDTSVMSVNVNVYGATVENNLSSYVFRCVVASSVAPAATKESDTILLSVVQNDIDRSVQVIQEPILEVPEEVNMKVGETRTIEIIYNGDGELSIGEINGPTLTATIAGNIITLVGLAEGTETITVKASEGVGYTEKTVLMNVNVIDVEKIFITEWTIPVDADGTVGSGTTIKLPIPLSENNNYAVNWGDGTTESFDSIAYFPTHTYTNTIETTYRIEISGSVNNFGYFEQFIPTLNNDYADYYTFTQYLTKIVQWGSVGVIRLGFANCINLAGEIPVPSEDSFTNLQFIFNLFYGCSSLTGEIPAGLFTYAPKIESAGFVFYGCSGLKGSIPANLFANNTKLNGFEYTFVRCSGLTGEIPANLFVNNTEATNFTGTFLECKGLTGEIPETLFENNTKITKFNGTFSNCTGLTGLIPAELFVNNTKATDFGSIFNNCSGLTGGELQIDTTNVTDMSSMFAGCTSLENLVLGESFKNLNGTNMFKNCTLLKAIIMLNNPETTAGIGTIADATTLGLASGTVIYVPSKKVEELYEEVITDISPERIERVIKAIEPNPDYVEINQIYIDPGYTVAGYTIADAEEWEQYGFSVEIIGSPVDTSELGSKWITYKLAKEY